MESLIIEEKSFCRPETVRGEIRRRWEKAGKPNWSLDRTIGICKVIDEILEDRGICSAPSFREKRKAGNEEYVESWVKGLKLCWIW